MILPNAERAVVPIEKLINYSLNASHEVGKHKAKVFVSALNLYLEDAEFLRIAIVENILVTEAIHFRTNAFGEHYFVDFNLTFKGKIAPIRTKWTIDPNVNFPRLTSCYVKRKAKSKI
jgi:hypothetical protein